MQKLKRAAVLFFVLFTTVGCDQATKSIAQAHLSTAEPRSFLNGTFWLLYAENSGAFLSMGAGLSDDLQHLIFTVSVTIVLLFILLFTLRTALNAHISVIVAMALFLGGGIGNLIDRITNDGRVIDFMHISLSEFGLGMLQTGVFNVADMALMAGVVLLGFYSLRTQPAQAAHDTQT